MYKLSLAFLIIFLSNIILTAQNHNHEGEEKVTIPESMKTEHHKLHAALADALKEEGELGEAAKEVERVLHPHFVKEEELAMPPLGLLTKLSSGEITEDMKSYITMTDKLKAELPQMLNEHKEIVKILDKFEQIAKKENKTRYVQFAEDLKLHASTEEEVTYPASILVGEYLKLKFKM